MGPKSENVEKVLVFKRFFDESRSIRGPLWVWGGTVICTAGRIKEGYRTLRRKQIKKKNKRDEENNSTVWFHSRV